MRLHFYLQINVHTRKCFYFYVLDYTPSECLFSKLLRNNNAIVLKMKQVKRLKALGFFQNNIWTITIKNFIQIQEFVFPSFFFNYSFVIVFELNTYDTNSNESGVSILTGLLSLLVGVFVFRFDLFSLTICKSSPAKCSRTNTRLF